LSGDLVSTFDALRAGGVAFTGTGLTIEDPEISFEHYRRVGRQLGALGDCVRFAAGDWMNAGLAIFGDDAYDAFDALGVNEDTLDQYRWVAEAIPPERRRVGRVRWSLHRLVAKLEPAEQVAWLDRAEEDRLLYRELKAQLDAVEGTRVLGEAVGGAETADPADLDPTSGEVVEARETGSDAVVRAARTLLGEAVPRRRGGRVVRYEVIPLLIEKLRAAVDGTEQRRLIEVEPRRKGEPGS
jgi:hypothetical protein